MESHPQVEKLSTTSLGRSFMERRIGELSEQEFCVHCYILDLISIQLSNREASSTNRLPHTMVYFIKKQFAASL